MKTIRLLALSLIVSGFLGFTSCSEDNTTPEPLPPTVNFVGGSEYVSGDVTLPAGTAFKVGINAFQNATSKKNLKEFSVTRVFNNKPTVVFDTTFNLESFNAVFYMNANLSQGVENIIFRVTDKDDQYAEVSFNVTTTPATGGPINNFEMKILGAQDNPTGSSFASVNGNVYTLADAKANAAIIDWLYYNGNVNHATLAAPDDADAATVFDQAVSGLQTWAVHNPTRFKLVTDAVDWNAITDDKIVLEQTASGVTNSAITQLAVGNILSFITSTGKKGMIKVENITGTNAGSMTISVKVQQ